jgi:hypothetical protein
MIYIESVNCIFIVILKLVNPGFFFAVHVMPVEWPQNSFIYITSVITLIPLCDNFCHLRYFIFPISQVNNIINIFLNKSKRYGMFDNNFMFVRLADGVFDASPDCLILIMKITENIIAGGLAEARRASVCHLKRDGKKRGGNTSAAGMTQWQGIPRSSP